MIAYRPHRGSLADAMKEAKTFLNEWQMKRYVANNWNLAIGRKVLDPEDIIIDSESTDDDRVGWKNVHMVCAARIGNEDYMKKYGNPQCIGYCAYDVSNVPISSPWICAKNSAPGDTDPRVIGFDESAFDIVIANYDEQFKEWRDDEGKIHNITYWMPLPEPPVKY